MRIYAHRGTRSQHIGPSGMHIRRHMHACFTALGGSGTLPSLGLRHVACRCCFGIRDSGAACGCCPRDSCFSRSHPPSPRLCPVGRSCGSAAQGLSHSNVSSRVAGARGQEEGSREARKGQGRLIHQRAAKGETSAGGPQGIRLPGEPRDEPTSSRRGGDPGRTRNPGQRTLDSTCTCLHTHTPLRSCSCPCSTAHWGSGALPF